MDFRLRFLNVSRNLGTSFEIKGLGKQNKKKMEKGKTEKVSIERERNNSFWTGYRCTISVMLDLRTFIRKGGKKPEDIAECENIN